jgi:hypothetical protein
VAGIDWGHAGGEQCDKRGLRPLQNKGDFIIPIGDNFGEVIVPGLTRVDAQPFGSLALHQVPGAFDVGRSERLAVVPFYTLAQVEEQLSPVFVPGPIRSELGHNGSQAVLRDVLVEQDEVVHHRHHRAFGHHGRFFVDRHAGRAVDDVLPEDAARFLGKRSGCGGECNQQPNNCR